MTTLEEWPTSGCDMEHSGLCDRSVGDLAYDVLGDEEDYPALVTHVSPLMTSSEVKDALIMAHQMTQEKSEQESN